LPERDFYLPIVLDINKNVKYLVVRRASWHEYVLALQPDLVVPGKRTVLSVEPCLPVWFKAVTVTPSSSDVYGKRHFYGMLGCGVCFPNFTLTGASSLSC
jgi:hypothetical protein